MEFPGRVYRSNDLKIIMYKENMETVVNLCKEVGYHQEIKTINFFLNIYLKFKF